MFCFVYFVCFTSVFAHISHKNIKKRFYGQELHSVNIRLLYAKFHKCNINECIFSLVVDILFPIFIEEAFVKWNILFLHVLFFHQDLKVFYFKSLNEKDDQNSHLCCNNIEFYIFRLQFYYIHRCSH